ncbi:MAG: phosphoribosylamine--glycine ligase, partial [Clostridiales bacterium]|nr:phosphoribosylamine--glycine ligase [Clostridiales bacterium]
WKIAQSPDCGKIFFAPGNGGTASIRSASGQISENVDISVSDINGLADFAEKNADFTVVGPELPLSLGIADAFRERALRVFGPDRRSARLETSKAYAKAFMRKYDIPTAAYSAFDEVEAALAALPSQKFPLWVKADGLAAGKGAVFCPDEETAYKTVVSMMMREIFGAAGMRVVLEEHMEGRELTLLCLTDGETILPMDSARDYKRALDGDEGLNTGGMGSISPVPGFGGLTEEIKRIMENSLRGIQGERLDYRGVLYIGLMLTREGPKVVEYNARFGDPETQALLPRLDSDLLKALCAVNARKLSEINLRWKTETAVCVVAAAGGYPEQYATGQPIAFAGESASADAAVFHAGTRGDGNKTVTAGGRVLAVTALGSDTETAREKAYKALEGIHFQDIHYRKDIGL